MITRRALLATPLFGKLSFAKEERRVLKLGEMDITIFSDGVFTLPTSQAYPTLSKEELDKLSASATTIMNTNIVLVKTGNDICIFDTGGGYNFLNTLGKLAKNLENASIDLEKITKVILTHAHADHLWGALDEFNTPAFPKAKFYIHAKERDDWLAPKRLENTPDAFKNITVGTQRILKTLEPVLEMASPSKSIASGVTFIETFGHTAGHCSVMLESKGEKLVLTGDAINNEILSFSHPHLDWGMDNDKQQGTVSRKNLLALLEKEKIPLIGYHFSNNGFGRVEKHGTAYRFI